MCLLPDLEPRAAALNGILRIGPQEIVLASRSLPRPAKGICYENRPERNSQFRSLSNLKHFDLQRRNELMQLAYSSTQQAINDCGSMSSTNHQSVVV